MKTWGKTCVVEDRDVNEIRAEGQRRLAEWRGAVTRWHPLTFRV
jgi:hypothetical protein